MQSRMEYSEAINWTAVFIDSCIARGVRPRHAPRVLYSALGIDTSIAMDGLNSGTAAVVLDGIVRVNRIVQMPSRQRFSAHHLTELGKVPGALGGDIGLVETGSGMV